MSVQELSAEFLRGLTDETEGSGTCGGEGGGGSLDGFERSSVKDGSEMAEEADADDDQRRVRLKPYTLRLRGFEQTAVLIQSHCALTRSPSHSMLMTTSGGCPSKAPRLHSVSPQVKAPIGV